MSAQSQRQQATPPPERQPHQRYSTETRLAIVETRWQDVVPTLATKTDIALIKKDIEAVEQRLSGEIQAVEQRLTGKIEAVEQRLSGEIQTVEQRLTGKIQTVEQQLTGEIQTVKQQLTGKIEAVEQRLSGEIQTVEQRLTGEMGTLRKDMDAMMNKIIIRVASIAVAAIAATGTIVALIQKIAN